VIAKNKQVDKARNWFEIRKGRIVAALRF